MSLEFVETYRHEEPG